MTAKDDGYFSNAGRHIVGEDQMLQWFEIELEYGSKSVSKL